jgi:hypothetical protein
MPEKSKLKIVKVGHKSGKTFVHVEEDKAGDVLKTFLDSDQPANPEFHDALKNLGKYMCGLLGFPPEWTATHTCNQVSIGHEEDDRINAVVTIYVALAKFNNGITINSPCLREKVVGASGGGAFMKPKMLELVQEVMNEGQKYYDGDRAQLPLPMNEKDGEAA